MYIRILTIIPIIIFFSACSPKNLFPTDNTEYDSIKNYNYDYTEHIFKSKDNVNLHGLHIKTPQEPKGLVVVVNGMHKNMSDRFSKWLWMVDSGYNVFIFDYRGYGKSEDLPDLYGFLDDVNAGIEYAHLLDKDKDVILIGQSMGGSFIIDALARSEYDYISIAVSDSTFTGFDSILNDYMMKSIILFPLSWLPYTFAPKELNSIENIMNVKVPILFISGDSDWIVSSQYSKELYTQANEEKYLWIVKGKGHVESFEDKRVQKSFLKLLKNKELLVGNRERYFNTKLVR